jgi:hypothetical protein
MSKKLLPITFLLVLSFGAVAQKNRAIDKSASFTTAFGSKQFTTALSYEHLWKIGKKQKLAIGGGLRLTNSFGNNLYYTTAPAKLTSGKTGPGVLFADDIPQNIDSVLFKKAQVNALNVSVNFTYAIAKKITLGFNIDAIGFSFGGKQKGSYLGNGGIGAATTAKPTSFNILLISDNDRGALNSEFFAQYKFNQKWGAKLGFQFLFTEYTTDTKVQTTPDGQKNDRFRNKASGISLGVTYSLKK